MVDQKFYSDLARNDSIRRDWVDEVEAFNESESVLKRFSLNGDGKLDKHEFILAMKRVCKNVDGKRLGNLYDQFTIKNRAKLDSSIFCKIMCIWKNSNKSNQRDEDVLDRHGKRSQEDRNVNLRMLHAYECMQDKVDVLHNLFVRMDIECSGCVSLQEFELALNHIGVFLNVPEFTKLCKDKLESVMEEGLGNNEKRESISYRKLIQQLKQSVPESGGSTIQKLWDIVLMQADDLIQAIKKLEKNNVHQIAPDAFRELLHGHGIVFSSNDFSILRMQLKTFSLPNGQIVLSKLIKAFQHQNGERCHKAPSKSKGRRLSVIHKNESTNAAIAGGLPGSARQIVADNQSRNTVSNDTTASALKARIIHQIHEVLPSNDYETFHSVFKKDCYGQISRGSLRQALAQLGVVARNAEVETLFWNLDSECTGNVSAVNLYAALEDAGLHDHMEANHQTILCVDTKKHAITAKRIVIDKLLESSSKIIQACSKIDKRSKGLVSKVDFLWALKEAGIILSCNDANTAVAAVSNRRDGVVMYRQIPDILIHKCSELLSPQSRSKHLTLASASMQANAVQPLESPPRRRLKKPIQSQTQSTIDLTFQNANVAPACIEPTSQKDQERFVQLASNMLEHRQVLKRCFSQFTASTYNDTLSMSELQNALRSSRLLQNLSPQEATKFVKRVLYAPSVNYATFIHCLVSFVGSASETVPEDDAEYKVLHHATQNIPTSLEASIQQKLRSCHKFDNIQSEQGKRSAGIVVRHAFRGHSSSDTVTTSSDGNFDASCRAIDLHSVCSRLGLDFTKAEIDSICHSMDATSSIHSSRLVQYFTAMLI